MGNFQAAPNREPQTVKQYSVEFAAQSDEDRAKTIDHLFCEFIEHEGFRKLIHVLRRLIRGLGWGSKIAGERRGGEEMEKIC